MHEFGLSGWSYALLCIVIPMLWGLVVMWASNRIENVIRRHRPDRPMPPVDYHI